MHHCTKCTKRELRLLNLEIRKNRRKRREIRKTVTWRAFSPHFSRGQTHNSFKNAFFLYNSAKKKKIATPGMEEYSETEVEYSIWSTDYSDDVISIADGDEVEIIYVDDQPVIFIN